VAEEPIFEVGDEVYVTNNAVKYWPSEIDSITYDSQGRVNYHLENTTGSYLKDEIQATLDSATKRTRFWQSVAEEPKYKFAAELSKGDKIEYKWNNGKWYLCTVDKIDWNDANEEPQFTFRADIDDDTTTWRASEIATELSRFEK
jgi:hypothetical protein